MKSIFGAGRRRSCLVLAASLAGLMAPVALQAQVLAQPWRNSYTAPDVEETTKPEEEVVFPAFPKPENFVEFYTGPTAVNRFFVDTTTLRLSADGTVHFVLLVQTSGGARNISFEGMHCPTPEHRIYATGGIDGTWRKARRSEWLPVREAEWNRHYAELFLEYFCRPGNGQLKLEQIVAALKERRMLPK